MKAKTEVVKVRRKKSKTYRCDCCMKPVKEFASTRYNIRLCSGCGNYKRGDK